MATALYNGIFVVWHVPAFYDATLRSDLIHAVEHANFVAVGLVFWGIIVAPSTRLPGASVGARLVMLFAANVINFMLGFTLAFSHTPFYTPYVTRPHLWGLTAGDHTGSSW